MGDVTTLSSPTEEDLNHIRDWVRKQPHLPMNIPDEQLMLFLHSCYSRLELTKKTVDLYYTMKTTTPEFFSDRNLSNAGLKHITKIVQICILPKRTEKGFSVMCARLKKFEADKFVLDDAIKLLFMVVDTCLRIHTLTKGVVFVFDNAGLNLGHLTRVNLSSLKKYFVYIQESMPVRIKSIHVVNVNPVMPHVMTLIRPFIKKEHMKYINLHTTEKVGEMFSVVPQEILPEDYTGKEVSMDILSEQTLKYIKSEEDWFRFDETLRIDETKLCGKDQIKNGYVGSFKKLNID